MNTVRIKGNIFAILTMFLLVFVAGIIGNKFLDNKIQASVVLGYALISLSFGAFVGMCFMINETLQDIQKLEDENLHVWDALQDKKMNNINNIVSVHQTNIQFYESKIAEYQKIINEKVETSTSYREVAYLDGHISLLQMLIKESKSKLEKLLLS